MREVNLYDYFIIDDIGKILNKRYDIKMNIKIIKNEISDSRFMPELIMRDIEKIKKMWKITMKIRDEKSSTIIIKVPVNYNTNKIIKIMKIAIFMMYLPYHNQTKFDITIYPSKEKKYFPKKGGVFDIDHINSGETLSIYQGNEKTRTYNTIFREEELYKVLIHELHHSIEKRLDWGTMDLNVNREINLNETYTESIAAILSIIVLGKTTYKKTLMFSLFQSAKILYLSGMTLDDLLGESGSHDQVRQCTSTVEYHILKAALIYDIDNYMNNIMFQMDGKLVDKMKESIISALKNHKFRKIIDHYMDKLKNNKIKDKECLKTGRMTPFT